MIHRTLEKTTNIRHSKFWLSKNIASKFSDRSDRTHKRHYVWKKKKTSFSFRFAQSSAFRTQSHSQTHTLTNTAESKSKIKSFEIHFEFFSFVHFLTDGKIAMSNEKFLFKRARQRERGKVPLVYRSIGFLCGKYSKSVNAIVNPMWQRQFPMCSKHSMKILTFRTNTFLYIFLCSIKLWNRQGNWFFALSLIFHVKLRLVVDQNCNKSNQHTNNEEKIILNFTFSINSRTQIDLHKFKASLILSHCLIHL